MNAIVDTVRAPSRARIYWLQIRNECLRMLRTPMYAIPTIVFPLVFYVMFAVLMNRGSGKAGAYLLATYGVFGVMGAAMFGFGVTVAMERTQGWLRLQRALPVPPGAYLAAKMGVAMLFALIISLCLLGLAVSMAGVEISALQALQLIAVNLLGTLQFAAFGLYIGTMTSGNAAPAILNIVFLPMAVLSGLWMPLSVLPEWIAKLAPVWPSYHLAQIALNVIGQDAGRPLWLHAGVLLMVTGVFGWLARGRLARAE